MNIGVPSDKLALQVWWAMTWRILPLVLLGSFAVGFFIGIIAAVTKTSSEVVQMPATLAGALVGLFVSVKIIKLLMTKGFGNYRLVVVNK